MLPFMSKIDDELRAARLREAISLAKKGDTTGTARFFGWNLNTFRSHANGTRGIRSAAGKRYAKALKVSYPWLMTGAGLPRGPGIDERLMRLEPELRENLTDSFNRTISAIEQSNKPKD